ncbi:MAG TPA: hypothetical protein VNO84_11690 [Burkholderiaceae bacterium]|nr:hypothetical protein [Burkholderiaceae bacterium]
MHLNLIPRHLPAFLVLWDDLGRPPAASLARAFGVSERTARRWISRDDAPGPVMVALWLLSRWGQHALVVEAERAARDHAGYARALREQLERTERELRRVLALNKTGAANLPLLQRMPLLWSVRA